MIVLLAGLAAGGLMTILVYLIIFCLILWLAYYVINNLAPEPFRRILNVILVVIAVVLLCYFLLSFVGSAPRF